MEPVDTPRIDPDLDVASGALEELTVEECLALVGTMSIGRVAVAADGGAPLVVPVNYALDGEVVVFRSAPGTKVLAVQNAPLSFQVDLFDPSHRTGWSVLIRGRAYEAADREVRHLSLEPWAPGDRSHWIRVMPNDITGRRIRLPDAVRDPRSYA